jgi:hypothetical protein
MEIMRSSLALFGAVGLLLVSASGCRLEAHTQTQFEDSSQAAKTATKDWNGEPISIQNDGINPLGGTGGVEVKVSSAATKISVDAIFAARADDDKESDAQASIRDAIQTLQIVEDGNRFTVKCGHGGAHGTSNVAGSGCKIIRVTIPAGTTLKPHDLTVTTGSGSIRLGKADGGDAVPYVKNLRVENKGLGETYVRVNPVKDATMLIFGDDAVEVALPANFSSQKVTLTVDEADGNKAAARKITNDFPGIGTPNGGPYPSTGATADAAADLNVNSTGPFDDDTITIRKF